MIILLIVNNILVIIGIKFSYSEDDRDETGRKEEWGYCFLIFFFLFLFLFIQGKKIWKN